MKQRYLFLMFLPLVLASHAEIITWTATGTVSSVAGSGFSAAPGNPVEVKFSYQTGASINSLSFFSFPSSVNGATEFYGNIGLTMEVTIASATWKGVVASSAINGTYSLHTDAWDGNGPSDTFTVLASSADSAVFSPFPYTGASTARSIQVVLQDNTTPANFISVATLPTDSAAVSNITVANGAVIAGSDRINFTLAPASVAVVSDAPRIPLKIARTPTGIELRWPSQSGVSYRLEECDSLTGWQPYGSYPGSGSDIVVTLNPFNDHPIRRFYRVVTE